MELTFTVDSFTFTMDANLCGRHFDKEARLDALFNYSQFVPDHFCQTTLKFIHRQTVSHDLMSQFVVFAEMAQNDSTSGSGCSVMPLTHVDWLALKSPSLPLLLVFIEPILLFTWILHCRAPASPKKAGAIFVANWDPLGAKLKRK